MHGVRLLGGGRGVAHWTDDPAYLPVWRHIAQLGVPVNAQTTQPEILPNTRRLLEQIPELRLTVNYLGHVPVGEGAGSPAAKELLGLAEYPAVYVNVAVEFLEKALEAGSPAEELLQAVLDTYGARRFLWSAFFPSAPGYPFEVSTDIVRRSLAFLSEEDQRWAAGDAARSLYSSLQPD
jgi:predicted TIM-barrel fold metal-dependent hydrolase